MGVLNLSPESFYQGSVLSDPSQVYETVQRMEKDGADFIDVGAASTAPKNAYGTIEVSQQKELKRIRETLGLIVECTRLPISIDTRSASVAEEALRMGAALINDTSGLRADSQMAKLVADNAVPIILMANCGEPCLSIESSLDSLGVSIRTALGAGVNSDLIIIDPGIGFGKPAEIDCAILRGLRAFSLLGHPLLVGVSRKAFIGNLLGLPDPAQRLAGTIAATSIAVLNGADIIRAHDVREARVAAAIGEALRTPVSTAGDNVEILAPCNEREAELLIRQVGASSEIIRQLANKALTLSVVVRDVLTPAALVLKQEMLALGGDAAYHYDVIDHKTDRTDVLIIGTPLHLSKLVKRISTMRDFGLDKIGARIRDVMSKRRC
ncbi:MAG: dihydropteroate synthase [Candidatus Thorarchaeota archaeon]|nr:MAG: dihydropteroate synthase [Candidatus Thorarchaeota archaeon]